MRKIRALSPEQARVRAVFMITLVVLNIVGSPTLRSCETDPSTEPPIVMDPFVVNGNETGDDSSNWVTDDSSNWVADDSSNWVADDSSNWVSDDSSNWVSDDSSNWVGDDSGSQPGTETATSTETATETTTTTETATATETATTTTTETNTVTETATTTATQTETNTTTTTETATATVTATQTTTNTDTLVPFTFTGTLTGTITLPEITYVTTNTSTTTGGGDGPTTDGPYTGPAIIIGGGGTTGTAGCNYFTVVDGNATRQLNELRTPVTVGRLGLNWIRFHNTRPRGAAGNFGSAGSWRHSWQFDLTPAASIGGVAGEYEFVYPSGVRRVLHPTAAGKWAADTGLPEKAWTSNGNIMVRLYEGSVVTFRPVNLSPSVTVRQAQIVTDRGGRATRLDYDTSGCLTRVTEPGGRQLNISYRTLEYKQGRFDLKLAGISGVPAAGKWIELDVAPEYRGTEFQFLRLRGAKGVRLSVAEIQFFAPGSSTPLAGRAYGSGESAAAAFDGNAGTAFVGAQESNYVALDLGPARKTTVAKIRVLPAAGSEVALKDAVLEGMGVTRVSKPVIAKVSTGAGAVTYAYDVFQFENTPTEALGLVGATYDDGSQATHRYAFIKGSASRPLLVESDDPAYIGPAKRIRYTYHETLGMIHQEINPATGAVWASLELDRNDAQKRTVTYADLKTETYRLDAQKRIVEKVDSLGRVSRWGYGRQTGVGPALATIDAEGRRIDWIKDSSGNVVSTLLDGRAVNTATWDAKNRVLTRTNPYGQQRVETFARSASGTVRRVRHPNSTEELFTYNAQGKLTERILPNGRFIRAEYDSSGRRTAFTNANGVKYLYKYDDAERLSSIVDPAGGSTRLDRNRRGAVTRITAPDGTHRDLDYDKYGRLTSKTDELGRATRFTYDELGRILREESPSGRITAFDYADLPQGCSSCSIAVQPSRIVQPDGRVTQYVYDTEGRILARTDEAGSPNATTVTYSYDAANRITSITDRHDGVTKRTYDREGRLVREVDPAGRARNFAYDAAGHLAAFSDRAGRVSRWTYDAQGHVTSVTRPGVELRFTYDTKGRRSSMTDAAGGRTVYDYNADGTLASRTNPLGETTRYRYDATHRRTGVTHPDGKSLIWSFDALGRRATTTTPDGLQLSYSYDARNRLIGVTDNLGRRQSYSFDSAGRPVSVTDALGRTTRTSYDSHDNAVSVAHGQSHQFQQEFDRDDRLVGVARGSRNSRYQYSANGDNVSFVDESARSHRFEYDKWHRRIARLYPDGSRESQAFDALGRLTSYVSPSGTSRTVKYDALDDAVEETWSGPAGSSAIKREFDSAGRLVKIDNGSVQLTYTYNILGKIESETSDLRAILPSLPPQTVRYRYDAAGRCVGLSYPDGTALKYAFNNRNQLLAVERESGGAIASFTYDSSGRRASIARENNVRTRYDYDPVGQVTAITHEDQNQTLASSVYAYNADGYQLAHTREDNLSDWFTYDGTGQLSSASYGGYRAGPPRRKVSYNYDDSGNLKSMAEAGPNGRDDGTVTFTSNDLDQYVAIGGAGGATCQYDADGNLIRLSRAGAAMTYRYNALGQLVGVESPSRKADMIYDPSGRCVVRNYYTKNAASQWERDNSSSRILTYAGWKVAVERQADGTVAATYVHGPRPDEVLQAITPAGRFQPLADALGNTVALTDAAGRVTERFRYDAFGMPAFLTPTYQSAAQSSTGYRWLFCGREWLPGFDLYDFRNRVYSPVLTRWLTRDPIRTTTSRNLYAMAANNPVNFVDSNGLWETSVHFSIVDNWLPASPYQSYPWRMCCIKVRDLLKEGSNIIDGFVSSGSLQGWIYPPGWAEAQASDNSYQHAMRRGERLSDLLGLTPTETVSQARQRYNDFVDNHLWRASQGAYWGRQLGRCEEISIAVREIGYAYHSVSDETSPAHAGFQDWLGPIDGIERFGGLAGYLGFYSVHHDRETPAVYATQAATAKALVQAKLQSALDGVLVP